MKKQPSDVGAIESSIAQTRQDIADTITTLQGRLQPQHIIQGARDALVGSARDTTDKASQTITQAVSDLGTSLQERLHDAPTVTAVLGAILTWLNTLGRQADHLRQSVSVSDAPARAQSTIDQATTQMRDQAEQLATQARDRVGDVADQVHQGADQLSQQAQEQITQSLHLIEETLKERPWLLGVLTLAAGIALGLVLPESAQERAWVGNARDALTQNIRAMATEALSTVKSAAQAAMQTTPPPEPLAPPPSAT